MEGFREPELARDQIVLWAEKLDDAVPLEHPVRRLEELFRAEQFASVVRRISEAARNKVGNQGYDPRWLTPLCVYCMLIKVRSSRQIEAACRERLDVMWLVSKQTPDHATISRFIRRHRKPLKELLKATIEVGIRAGLIRLEYVAIDGTFVEADAGRKSVLRRDAIEGRLKELDEAVTNITREYMKNESVEAGAGQTTMQWSSSGSAESPEEKERQIRKQQAALKAALQAIEERKRQARRADQPPPKDVASTTDADARVIKDKEGRSKLNYNVQMAVDSECGMVVATGVSDAPNDAGQMIPMLMETKANCGRLPDEAGSDAGYSSGREVAALEGMKITAYVNDPAAPAFRKATEAREILRSGGSLSLQQIEALPRDKRGCFHHACFVFDESTDTFRCPAGETLTRRGTSRRSDRWGPIERIDYVTKACATCQHASACHRSKTEGRRISRTEHSAALERMRERTLSEEGRKRATVRSSTVEPRFGQLKAVEGVRRLLRRGIENATTEIGLLAATMNVRKLINHWPLVRQALAPPGG